MSATGDWICCQLGAREHYAVPKALSRVGALSVLITDAWISPSSVLGRLGPRRLRGRFDKQIDSRLVSARNVSALAFEMQHAVRGTRGWALMSRRNQWFQDIALKELEAIARRQPGKRQVVFAFSYSARRPFQFARSVGWLTVMGQIDPGPVEERIVMQLHREHPSLADSRQFAPADYWQQWREECNLADRVIVNSPWSRQAMIDEGVAAHKLAMIPLAYEPPADAARFRREYPDRFTFQRPLRVLFLGQVNLRKGIAPLLDAARAMRDDPVEFWVVGPAQIDVPAQDRDNPNIHWMGSVPRAEAAEYYRRADVFLFPTLSDGFGLTQLEAQAWALPVVASWHCGDVVQDGVNGVRLTQVSGQAITTVLRAMVADAGRLASMSRASAVTATSRLDQVGQQLVQVVA